MQSPHSIILGFFEQVPVHPGAVQDVPQDLIPGKRPQLREVNETPDPADDLVLHPLGGGRVAEGDGLSYFQEILAGASLKYESCAHR